MNKYARLVRRLRRTATRLLDAGADRTPLWSTVRRFAADMKLPELRDARAYDLYLAQVVRARRPGPSDWPIFSRKTRTIAWPNSLLAKHVTVFGVCAFLGRVPKFTQSLGVEKKAGAGK